MMVFFHRTVWAIGGCMQQCDLARTIVTQTSIIESATANKQIKLCLNLETDYTVCWMSFSCLSNSI